MHSLTPRRTFLADMGMGFTGLVLGAMLHRDGIAGPERRCRALVAARRPAALRAQGQERDLAVHGRRHQPHGELRPQARAQQLRRQDDRRDALPGHPRLAPPEGEPPRARQGPAQRPARRSYPLQVGYRKRGQSGIEVSDWWPNVGDCIDDIAVVRSMWTTDNDHGAQLQFHTGRHMLEGRSRRSARGSTTGSARSTTTCPSSSSWARRSPTAAAAWAATAPATSAPSTTASSSRSTPRTRCPSPRPEPTSTARSSASEFDLLGRLNRLSAVQYPDDPAPAGPDQVVRAGLPDADGRPRGLAGSPTSRRASASSTASTTTPRGPSASSAWRRGGWSSAASGSSRSSTAATAAPGPGTPTPACGRTTRRICAQVDRPIAGLLKDLKQRGLLDETIVVWATEFGRTPGAQGGDGRDHHPFGFSVWMAGGGIKGGVAHGATDELGFHAVENRHYVTDIHATVLHQLGLDPRRLEVPGQKRLEIDFGQADPREILAMTCRRSREAGAVPAAVLHVGNRPCARS